MDVPLLDLRLLMVLDRLIARRSVSAVAHDLQMPQSTVSRCLSQLRDHFRDPLVVRTRAGMAPTPAALAVAETVRTILDLYRDRLARPDRFDPATAARVFALAASDFGHLLVLPKLQALLAAQVPGARVNAVTLSGERPLIGLLETGEADVAIGGFPALYAGVRQRLLFTEHYVCVVRAGHPGAGDAGLTEAQFTGLQHVLVTARAFGHIHQSVEKQLTELLPAHRIAITSQSFVLAALIAERADLVLTVPSRVIKALDVDGRFRQLHVPWLKLPSFDVALYWHERFDRDPANCWLRSAIASLALDH